ncbi:MAG: hypothetical protein AMXMBFR75_32550 [Candidatus Hinthialibacteria bacterium]
MRAEDADFLKGFDWGNMGCREVPNGAGEASIFKDRSMVSEVHGWEVDLNSLVLHPRLASVIPAIRSSRGLEKKDIRLHDRFQGDLD